MMRLVLSISEIFTCGFSVTMPLLTSVFLEAPPNSILYNSFLPLLFQYSPALAKISYAPIILAAVLRSLSPLGIKMVICFIICFWAKIEFQHVQNNPLQSLFYTLFKEYSDNIFVV